MVESKKIKVFLIEDDKTLIDMYTMKFTEVGMDLIVSDKGSECFAIAKKEMPDIILLDIILPEVDGFAILEALKKDAKTKNIPVILLSNLGQESDKQKGLKLGASEYCIKAEYTPMQLVEKIKTILKK